MNFSKIVNHKGMKLTATSLIGVLLAGASIQNIYAEKTHQEVGICKNSITKAEAKNYIKTNIDNIVHLLDSKDTSVLKDAATGIFD